MSYAGVGTASVREEERGAADELMFSFEASSSSGESIEEDSSWEGRPLKVVVNLGVPTISGICGGLLIGVPFPPFEDGEDAASVAGDADERRWSRRQ